MLAENRVGRIRNHVWSGFDDIDNPLLLSLALKAWIRSVCSHSPCSIQLTTFGRAVRTRSSTRSLSGYLQQASSPRSLFLPTSPSIYLIHLPPLLQPGSFDSSSPQRYRVFTGTEDPCQGHLPSGPIASNFDCCSMLLVYYEGK